MLKVTQRQKKLMKRRLQGQYLTDMGSSKALC